MDLYQHTLGQTKFHSSSKFKLKDTALSLLIMCTCLLPHTPQLAKSCMPGPNNNNNPANNSSSDHY